MQRLEKRVAALEQQRLYWHSGCNVIPLMTNESLDDGLKRLGRADASGCIVVRQILDPADWNLIAPAQQAELLKTTIALVNQTGDTSWQH